MDHADRLALDYTLAYAEINRGVLNEDEQQPSLDLLGVIAQTAMQAITANYTDVRVGTSPTGACPITD